LSSRYGYDEMTTIMSLQRIFESARRLGVPVIVTDPSGREPMVVLPLEQFEAMATAGEAAPRAPSLKEEKPEVSYIPSAQSQTSEAVRIQEKPLNREENVLAKEEMPNISADLAGMEEIPLEERFYLEPVEEEQG
jgi:hypothetical protein